MLWPAVMFAAALLAPTVSSQLDLPCQGCIARDKINIVVVSHGMKSSDWWRQVQRAGLAAGMALKVNLTFDLWDMFDTIRMANKIKEVATWGNVHALLVTIPNDNVYEAIGVAQAAGIPVFSFNSGYDVAPGLGIKAHVGMHEYNGGLFTRDHYKAEFQSRGLDLKYCIAVNQEAGNTALDLRKQGFEAFCTEEGVPTEEIAVNGANVDAMRRVLADRFQARNDANELAGAAILSLGTQPAMPVINEIKDLNMLNQVVIGTFDLNGDIFNAVNSGELIFGIDQQNFLQGLLPIFVATLYVTAGQLMAPEVYMTGPSYVTEAPNARAAACANEGHPPCECPWAGGNEGLVATDKCVPLGESPVPSPECLPCTDLRKIKIRGITHAEHHPFWYTVRGGALQAARDFRLENFEFELWEQFSLQAMADKIVETSKDPTIGGIFVSVPGGPTLNAITTAARNTKVVTINSGYAESKGLDPGNGNIWHHVGQHEYQGGWFGAKRLKALGATKVLVPNQEFGNTALDQRTNGAVDFASSADGAGLTIVPVPMSQEINTQSADAVRTYISQKLDDDTSIDGIFFLNANPCGQALPGVLEKSRTIHLGTFDTSAVVMEAIGRGEVSFAIDQLPYMQGYMAVMLLVLADWTGLRLAEHVISSGPSFLTSANPTQDTCFAYFWDEERVGLVFADEYATSFPTCEHRPPVDCDPGFELNYENDCVPCQPGFHKGLSGQMPCEKCTLGTFSQEPRAARCADCPAGKFQQIEGESFCSECIPGTAAKAAASSACEACPLGTNSEIGASQCEFCLVGHYAPEVGLAECIQCTAPLQTEFPGSKDVLQCKCPAGSYADKSGECHECTSMSGQTCGFGSSVDGFQTGGAHPMMLPGYWASEEEPMAVYRCESTDHCPGGNPGMCAPNVIPQVCARCDDGYTWQGRSCRKCTSVETTQVLFPVVPIFVSPVLISTMYWFFRDTPDRWASRNNLVMALVFLCLNHYQIMNLVKGCNVDIPNNLASILNFWEWTTDLISLFRVDCAGFANFQTDFVMRSIGPILGGLLFVLTYAGSQLVSKFTQREELAMEKFRLLGIYLSLMFTFFNGISAISLSLFKCKANPNERLTLSKDLSIGCYSSAWTDVLVVAIFAVLIYCVAFTGLLVHALLVAAKHSSNDVTSLAFLMRWKFLFIKFRCDVHWWALAILMKGFLLNLGFVMFVSGYEQLYWIMVVNLVYSLSLAAFLPWRHRMANMLDLLASSCIVFACSLATNFAPEETIPAKDMTGNSIIPISFSPILVAMALMVHRLYSDAAPHDLVISRRDRVIKAFNSIVALPKTDATDFLSQLQEWDWAYLKGACRIIEGELLGQEKRTRVNVTRADSQKFTKRLQKGNGEAASANPTNDINGGAASTDLVAVMRMEMEALKKDLQLSVRGEVEAGLRDFKEGIYDEVPNTP